MGGKLLGWEKQVEGGGGGGWGEVRGMWVWLTLRLLSILESMMSCVWLALVRALKVRKTGTISAGRPFVSCCVMFRVLPAETSLRLNSDE